LADIARRRPLDTAVASSGGGRLTYEQWNDQSNAAAWGLVRRGVFPGDRVALLFDHQHWSDLAVAYVAVRKAGAAAVPLAPGWSTGDRARALGDCHPAAVVSPTPLQAVGGVTLDDLLVERGDDGPPPLDDAGHPAEILYPTGAMRPAIPWARTEAELERALLVPLQGELFLHAFAIGGPAASTAIRWPTAAAGGVVMAAPTSDPEAFAALVESNRPAALGVSSALAAALLQGAGRGRDLSSPRVVVLEGRGGPDLPERLATMFPGATVSRWTSTGAEATRAGWPPGTKTAPVSPAQEGMVWHEQFTPGSFNISPLVRRFRGPLNQRAMEAALGEIVARHDCLRARFAIETGAATQHFFPPSPFRLPMTDMGEQPVEQRLTEIRRLIADGRRRPMDLVDGPLFDPVLVRFGPDDHVLVIRVHHSVFDDWSVGPFRRELSTLYRAFAAGEPSPLAPLAVRFEEVCRREHRALVGAPGAAERRFWGEELAGAPLRTELPIDDPRRPAGSLQPATTPLTLEIDPVVATALRTLARSQRATVFMTTLAAFAVLVHRYTGQDDLVISTLVANRDQADVEGLIGCFSKKVLVRLRLDGDPTFIELIARTRGALLRSLAHPHEAYEAVVQAHLGPAATRHGLAPQVGIKFQAAVTVSDRVDLPGLTAGPLPPADGDQPHFLAGGADADTDGAPPWGAGLYLNTFLGLSLVDGGDRLAVVTEGVFHLPAVTRLLDHFATVLAQATAAPTRPISDLAVLDDRNLDQLDRWSRGPEVTSLAPALHTAVSEWAQGTPSRTAVTGGGRRLSFAQLDVLAGRLATAIQAAGAGKGSVVAVLAPPGPDAVLAVLAAWKAGAAYVGLDPLGPRDRWAAIIADAGVDVVVSGAADAGCVASLPPGVNVLSAQAARRAPPVGPDSADAAATALLWYPPAAGAGGRPVALDHRALATMAAGLQELAFGGPGEAQARRMAAYDTPASDSFPRLLAALANGQQLDFVAPDAAAISTLLADGHLDDLDCRPALFQDLLDGGLADGLARRPRHLPVPTIVVASNGPLDADLWPRWRRLTGARLYVLYGPPECAFAACALPAAEASARVTVGRPLANVTAEVLDERLRRLPVGAVGELHLAGASVAGGSGRRRHQASVVADASPPGGQWLPTGRRARLLPGGEIELLGERSATFDLRGFGIEPGPLAAAIASCPGVAAARVTLDEDAAGQPELVASVVHSANRPAPALPELRRHLWTRLPGCAWPARLVVEDHELQRHETAAARPSEDREPDATATSQETLLLALWAEAAGRPRGPQGNYWQSFSFLDALAAAAGIGSDIDRRLVLRHRTVETLATAADVEAAGAADGHLSGVGPPRRSILTFPYA
jgi:non-ribosomal peptide synthetase component F